jgi:thiosulfate reductase cytochrome b subunit
MAAPAKIRLKHPRAIRWFHWINFPILGLMIWSGLLIYWANDVYYPFFPEWFYRLTGIDHRLAEGMSWHFLLMWAFALNGAAYVAYVALSGEWRELLPGRHALADAWQATLHDLGIRETPLPRAKFNGAQRVAYTGVVLMGAGSLLTGLAIYKPVQAGALTALLGGYEWARWEHFWLTIGYVAFFGLHVAQVARAGWNSFRAMVSGYERDPL